MVMGLCAHRQRGNPERIKARRTLPSPTRYFPPPPLRLAKSNTRSYNRRFLLSAVLFFPLCVAYNRGAPPESMQDFVLP